MIGQRTTQHNFQAIFSYPDGEGLSPKAWLEKTLHS